MTALQEVSEREVIERLRSVIRHAVTVIESGAEGAITDTVWATPYETLVDMLNGALASSPAETGRMEWIPVGERIPEAGEDVLFWDGTMCFGFKEDDDPESHWWGDKLHIDRDGDYCDTFTVTHWMPLPASPVSPATKENT